MRVPKFVKIYLILMVCFTGQFVIAGSYFSSKAKGIGLRQYATGVRGIGMGYTGMASRDSLELNNFAVTQWRHINNTRATISLVYQRFNTDLSDNNFTSTKTDLTGLNIAIPIVKKKWVFGLSITPYSDIDFKSTDDISSNGEDFTQTDFFTGSISKAQFSLVWSPNPKLGLAVNGNFFFGTLTDRFEFRFENNNFRDISHRVIYRFRGPGIGLSADYQPTKKVQLAGFLDFPASVDMDVEYISTVEFPLDQPRNFDKFPLQFGIGGALQMNQRWQLTADFSRQQWADALKTPNPEFDSWYLFGVGVERAASRKRNTSMFNKMDLRSGFSARSIGYKFNNEPVKEYALHLGLGFPFGHFNNRVDFAISGGIRGDLTKNLAEEKFIKFNTSISIGEFWFQKIR